jgi:tetratricopeptide (TPR) repeat protein
MLDWKMPFPGGLGVFNRLRSDSAYRRTLVIVMSALLKKEDFAVVAEYPFTHYLSKPFPATILEEKLTEANAEISWYSNSEEEVSKALEMMSENRASAFQQLKSMFGNENKNTARLATMTASALRRGGYAAEAETILKKLVQSNPDSVLVLSELGRIYLQTNRYAEAEAMLMKAQTLSPKNAERLCHIGEAQLGQGKGADAASTFQKALGIDPVSRRATDGLSLATSVAAHFKETPQDSVPKSFASVINSVAIALVRQGKLQDGLKQYEAAMKFAVDDPEVVSKLAFNTGLALLRKPDVAAAKEMFKKSLDASGGTFAKAQQYVQMCERAGSSGKVVTPAEALDDVIVFT